MSDEPFLSRWARRKALSRSGEGQGPAPTDGADGSSVPDAVPVAGNGAPPASRLLPPGGIIPAEGLPASADAGLPQPDPPTPTMADVHSLGAESDFTPFMRAKVQPAVRNAALRKLFSDPHFNVMDGLDTYIDDYGKADPLPPGMLESMQQWQALIRQETPEPSPPEVPAESAGGEAALPATEPGAAGDSSAEQGASSSVDTVTDPSGPDDALGEARRPNADGAPCTANRAALRDLEPGRSSSAGQAGD